MRLNKSNPKGPIKNPLVRLTGKRNFTVFLVAVEYRRLLKDRQPVV